MSSSNPTIPPNVRDLVDRVCASMNLDKFAANTVERWVNRPPSTWPTCCLSDCDPCNGVLRSAARKVLEELEQSAE